MVDASDNQVGIAPKLLVHRQGTLHRAVSVFILNEAGEMLLQRRAREKYHSGGLWSNACCSHPRPGESPAAAAVRRLEEEMGLFSPLEHAFTFLYRAALQDGLTEHELDHVFVGASTMDPHPNSEEIDEWRWISLPELERELAEDPEHFTAWFPLAFHRLKETDLLPVHSSP